MFPPRFEYHCPATVREVTELLDRYGEDSRILAGGQSLLPMLKLRLIKPQHLIDINRIIELSRIAESNGTLNIGATVRESQIENSQIVAMKCRLLTEISNEIADTQIRNRGTLVGSLCNGDPSADYAPGALVLDAKFTAQSSNGKRIIPVASFFKDYFATDLDAKEFVSDVGLATLEPNEVTSFAKLCKSFGDFALVNVACVLRMEDGLCTKAKVALGAVGPRAIRVSEIEEQLSGNAITEESIKKASKVAEGVCEVQSDPRGSKDYKIHMAEVMTQRCLFNALEEAKQKRLA